MQRFLSWRKAPYDLSSSTNFHRSERCCISMINHDIRRIFIVTNLHIVNVIPIWDKKRIYGKMSKWVMNCHFCTSPVNSKEITRENCTAYEIKYCRIRLFPFDTSEKFISRNNTHSFSQEWLVSNVELNNVGLKLKFPWFFFQTIVWNLGRTMIVNYWSWNTIHCNLNMFREWESM